LQASGNRTRRAGFTILEVFATVLIVATIAVFLIPHARELFLRAGEAGCMANMRFITIALHGHLQDHQNVWPQGPSLNEEPAWEAFWLQALRSYGVVDKTWQCPSFNSALASTGAPVEDRPKVHYVPTTFPDTPGIATRWPTQPWLIERSSVHKNGPHICFPDGSVKSFHKVLAEHGLR
jgi:competence protein ComGC